MKPQYFRYKAKFTYVGEQYELHSVVGEDEEITKPKGKLLGMQELVNRENVGDLIVYIYFRYNHNNFSYTTLGYEICK